MLLLQSSLVRKKKINLLVDPLVLYFGGYRYNQPNHLYHKLMLAHASAYFLADSILEVAYKTDDFLMNCHHVCVLAVSYFGFTANHSGFEYLRKSYSD
jgi:hypothetical protein